MKSAVILISDHRCIFAMANVICQLRRHKYIDSIYIIIPDSPDEVAQNLVSIDPRVKKLPIDVETFENYLSDELLNSNFVRRWGTHPFLRFMALPLLEDYDNLIYLDIDILILKSFEEIISTIPISFRGRCPLSVYDRQVSSEFKMPNAGVVVVSRTILNFFVTGQSLRDVCFEILNKYANTENVDEFVWGYLVYKYNLPFHDLHIKYNCFPCQKGSRSAVIVHGAGSYKFWSHPLVNVLFPEWQEYSKIVSNYGMCQKTSHDPQESLTEESLFNSLFALEIFKIFSNDERFQINWNNGRGVVSLIHNNKNFSSIRIYLILKMYCVELRIEDVDEYRKQNLYFRKLFYSLMKGFRIINDKNQCLACSRFTQLNDISEVFNSFYSEFAVSFIKYSQLSSIAFKKSFSCNYLSEIQAKNTIVLLHRDGTASLNPEIPGLNLKFIGNNNLLVLYDPISFEDCYITLGSNNIVILEKTEFIISKLNASIFNFNYLSIKENFCSDECSITMAQELGICLIESNCVFDKCVSLTIDGSVTCNQNTSKCNSVCIGKFVKVGKNVTIKANSFIANGSCVNDYSSVGLQSTREKAFISGNPAFAF